MADTFVWASPSATTLSYDTPANWIDSTTPGQTGVAVPGTADTANLIGTSTGTPQTVTGPGAAATLDLSGLNLLAGSFSTLLTDITATSGTAAVTLAGTLAASQELVVGGVIASGTNTGSGLLTIGAGATATAASPNVSTNLALAIGDSTGSSGTVSILAGGSLLIGGAPESTAYDIAVGNYGSGTLLIAGAGATFDTGGNPLEIAANTGATGVIQVTGGGSVTTGSTNSSVTSAAAIGRSGAGTLIVSDPGSSFDANGNLYVGRANGAVMLIENYGIVTAGSLGSGASVGVGNSTLSTLTGGLGFAELNTHGTFDDIGSLVIGGVGVTGLMTVDDSLVEATGQILLGTTSTISNTVYTGTGTLEISNSGTVELNGTAHTGTGMGVGYASGSGGLVQVTGTGALLNLENNLLNIGNSGTGTVVVSQGASLTASSPAAGTAAIVIGNGTGGVGTLVVDGTSTVTALGPLTAGFSGSGTLVISNGGTVSAGNAFVAENSGATGAILVGAGSALAVTGTLTVNTGGAISVGGIAEIASYATGAGIISVGAAGDIVYGSSVALGLETDFSGIGGRIDLVLPAGFAGEIGNFQAGDTIVAVGATGLTYDGGTDISLTAAGGSVLGTIALTQTYAPNLFVINAGTITELPCFRAGTLIDTVDGPVPVEALRPGMAATTWRTGRAVSARITWTGHRRVTVARHPHPDRINPVRIARDAFGPGCPRRALYLSPDHAVFTGGVLIPVKHLINGTSIAQLKVREVEYWHVELERHDILHAEGLAVESYLDTGNRSAFAGQARTQLFPDFAALAWTDACAELVQDGPVLAACKAALFRAAGLAETRPPLALAARGNGRDLVPEPAGEGTWRYAVPPGLSRMQLRSPAWVPAHGIADSLDRRSLGIRLFALAVDGRPVPLDSPVFGPGFHPVETGAEGDCRWTDGSAELLLPAGTGHVTLLLGDGAACVEKLQPARSGGGRRRRSR